MFLCWGCIYFFSIYFPFLGGYLEYLEFPNQRRTKVQENNNYEPHFVSVRSVFLLFLSLLILIHLASFVLVFTCTLTNMAYLSWRNKSKTHQGIRAKLLEKYVADEKGEDGRLRAWMELGDRHPDFVYTLWIFDESLAYRTGWVFGALKDNWKLLLDHLDTLICRVWRR